MATFGGIMAPSPMIHDSRLAPFPIVAPSRITEFLKEAFLDTTTLLPIEQLSTDPSTTESGPIQEPSALFPVVNLLLSIHTIEASMNELGVPASTK